MLNSNGNYVKYKINIPSSLKVAQSKTSDNDNNYNSNYNNDDDEEDDDDLFYYNHDDNFDSEPPASAKRIVAVKPSEILNAKIIQKSSRRNPFIRRFLRKKTLKYFLKHLLFIIFFIIIIESIFYLKFFRKRNSTADTKFVSSRRNDTSSPVVLYNKVVNNSNLILTNEDTSSPLSSSSTANSDRKTLLKLIDYKEDLTVYEETLKRQESNENYLNMFNSIKSSHVEAYKRFNVSIELCAAIPSTLETRINFTHLFNNTNLADLINFYENFEKPKNDASNQTTMINELTTMSNKINFEDDDNENLLSLNENMIYGNTVQLGGYWKPDDCRSRSKLAVIIPYRDRFVHLAVLLRNLHLILQRQMIEYRIFVTEQYGNKSMPFNKGRIMNAAYLEALKIDPTFNCFVFHDVDLILEDDRNMYTCPPYPRHMSVAIDKFDYHLPYTYLIGGVFLLRTEHFRVMNGYSNSYWGWGGEDDDMYERLASSNLKLLRPLPMFGRYRMIKHTDQKSNPDRFKKLKGANKRYKNDGVNQINYILVNTTLYEGFTHFLFDIGEL